MFVYFVRLRPAFGATFLLALCSLPAVPQTPSDTPRPATCTVSGVVVNSVTGEAIRRALVQVQGGSPFHGSARTAPEGRFQIPNVPESDVIIAVRKPGFFNDQELHPENFEPSIIHMTSATEPLTLKLLPEGARVGHVAPRGESPGKSGPSASFGSRSSTAASAGTCPGKSPPTKTANSGAEVFNQARICSPRGPRRFLPYIRVARVQV